MKRANYATLLQCRTGQKYGSRRLNDPNFDLFPSFFRLDFPRDEPLNTADFFVDHKERFNGTNPTRGDLGKEKKLSVWTCYIFGERCVTSGILLCSRALSLLKEGKEERTWERGWILVDISYNLLNIRDKAKVFLSFRVILSYLYFIFHGFRWPKFFVCSAFHWSRTDGWRFWEFEVFVRGNDSGESPRDGEASTGAFSRTNSLLWSQQWQ